MPELKRCRGRSPSHDCSRHFYKDPERGLCPHPVLRKMQQKADVRFQLHILESLKFRAWLKTWKAGAAHNPVLCKVRLYAVLCVSITNFDLR